MTDTTNTDATLEWITGEIAGLEQQAAALEERLSVLREVWSRLTGVRGAGAPDAPQAR
jgi:hypothetical protein